MLKQKTEKMLLSIKAWVVKFFEACTATVGKVASSLAGFIKKHRLKVSGAAVSLAVLGLVLTAVIANGGVNISRASAAMVADTNDGAGVLEAKREVSYNSALTEAVTEQKLLEITVKADGDSKKVSLKMGKVSDALESAGIELSSDDSVKPSADTPLSDGMTVEVTRAELFEVTVKADGKSKKVKLSSGKVSDALKKAKITIDEDDTVDPDYETELTENMTVTVKRVEIKTVTEEKKIPYDTKITKTNKLTEGTTKVTTKGVNGVKQVTYSVKTVDGKKSSKTVVSERVTKNAVTEVKQVGTKKASVNVSGSGVISTLAVPTSVKFDSNGLPLTYKKVISGPATAYCDGTVTSTGKKVKQGYVAVNPNVIPYGTEMYIVSKDGKYVYGYAIAADTGGALKSGAVVVDLYMSDYNQTMAFGRRDVDIYILS